MKKEIEVKARLQNREEIVRNLESLGCNLSAPISQDDTIYAEKVGSFDIFNSNKVFARIRVQNDGKTIFTVKERAGALAALERELLIDSREEMEGALSLMGYKEGIRVKKIRQKTQYNGWEICLDEVEGLGSFVEVEEITDVDPEIVQKKLFDFLVSIGVKPDARVIKRYDILMFEKETQS